MAKYKKIDFDEMEVVNETNIAEVADDTLQTEEEPEEVNVKQTFTEKEKKVIAERVSAMSEEEQILVLKMIKSGLLWAELKRRNSKMQEKIDDVNSILGVYVSDINPISNGAWEGMIKRYSDVEERFTKITKGFN